MAKNVKDLIAQLPKERQQAIHDRAEELVLADMNLCELRKANALTQKEMAEKLGIGQDNVSRMENREDMKLSTLKKWVDAIGGQLELVIKFEDKPSVKYKI